jgi:pimeloyl-ACP methyl ester carboxylesterase
MTIHPARVLGMAEPVIATSALETLVGRYDPAVFEVGQRRPRVRLEVQGGEGADVLLHGGRAELVPIEANARADAVLSADEATWRAVADDLRGGMAAFRSGRLRVRRDLHLGVGFLAATAPAGGGREAGRLRFRHVRSAIGELSVMEAGEGPAVVALHGLGATKASFLPTVAALADSRRVIAMDLPGFGDSVKPIAARYDPEFFARGVVALLDALELDEADLVGNSMGGRVAIETGLRFPERVRGMVLLAPSLAWLRDRPWAPYLRLVPPQLGLIQPAPRQLVEGIVRRIVPGADDEQWTAAGVDEFLRSYLSPRGRAAFYAAARNIYLEEPHGEHGFWTRLPALSVPSLFVWGRNDPVVPIGFARHVREALPNAEHLELRCGHVPQLERPRETHEAIRRFLAA